MSRSPILTGAQVVLFVNGEMYGKVHSFHWNVETPRRDIRGVDSIIPFELAIATSKVAGTMSIYRLSRDGGAEGAGMIAPTDALSREKYFTMVLIDISSGFVVFQADHCSVDSQIWMADAKGIITGQVSWSAMAWNNEVRRIG
jgi:hypothetical protein